jgi:CBS domain-containing protein
MPADDKPAPKLTAADVMTPAPRTCSVFSSVLEAVLIFRDADCGAVPVVASGEPVGILTDRDVALALAEHDDLSNLEVGNIMTKGVLSVDPGDSLEFVASKFGATELHRLLVVDSGKILRGIISRSDLAPYLPDQTAGRFVSEVVQQPRATDLA